MILNFQNLAISITILAVAEINAAVSIRAAILVLGEWHAATLTELRQLAWLQGFLFLGEGGFVSFKTFWVLVGHEISFGWAISALAIAPLARNQFLGEEERHLFILRHVMVMDAKLAGEIEACVAVEVDVAFHLEQADTHFTHLLQRIV